MTTDMAIGIFGALAATAAGGWAVVRTFGYLVQKIVAQFELRLDERFAALEVSRADGRKVLIERITRIEERYERIDRELRDLLVNMPDKWVRREEYVRRETVIEAKIDRLGLQIQNWILENKHGN